MLRTSVLLKPTPNVRVSEYAEQAAIIWNIASYQRRRAFYEHMRGPSYVAQCRELEHTEPFKRLGTCKAQALLSKLNEAWQSFYALLRPKKRGRMPEHIRKVNPPRYWKKKGKRETKAFYVRNDGWDMNEKVISIGKTWKSHIDAESYGRVNEEGLKS